MTVTDEVLSAYLDGELPSEEAGAIRRALKSDAALAARLKRLKKLTPLITETYAVIDDEPLPEAVRRLLKLDGETPDAGPESNVVEFSRSSPPRFQTGWMTAMAASVALAIGVGVGLQFAPRNDFKPNNGVASLITPANPLYAALESTPSAQHIDTSIGTVTPILTFKSANGQYCREFLIKGEAVTNRAVACRTGERWVTQIAVLAPPLANQAISYVTASTDADMQINDFIDSIIDGDVLDVTTESELLGRW